MSVSPNVTPFVHRFVAGSSHPLRDFVSASLCARQSQPVTIQAKRTDMKIGILGTGMVGETIGTKFAQLGHQVKMGSRTANNEKAVNWAKTAGADASQGTFADTSNFGEMIFICLKGATFLEIAQALAPALAGKVVVDVSNPLD